MTDRRFIPAVALFLAAGLTSSLAVDAAAQPNPRERRVNAPAATGVVQPRRNVTLSVPLDGVIDAVHVKEGQQVQAGDLLAVMDHRVPAAALRAAEATAARTAAIEEASHDVAFQTWLVDRLLAANAQAGANEYQIREAKFTLDLRIAAHARAVEDQTDAKRQLDLARARVEERFIRAPFDGRITRVDAGPGETLATTEPLVQLVNLRELETELHLPAAMYPQLRPGLTAALQAGPPVDRPLHAVLTFVDPVIDPATQTVRCLFVIDNRDHTLPAGFTVRLPHDAVAEHAASVSSDSH